MARTKALSDGELAAERLRLLIEYAEQQHGSRAAAAAALGLSQSYVSKIASGERTSVGSGAVRTARETFGIIPRFFTDEELDPRGVKAYESVGRLAYEPETMKAEWLFGDAAVFIEAVARNPVPNNVRAFCDGLLRSPMVALATAGMEDNAAGAALARAMLPMLRGDVSQESREACGESLEPWAHLWAPRP